MRLKVRIKFPIKYNKNKIVIVMFHHSLMNADTTNGVALCEPSSVSVVSRLKEVGSSPVLLDDATLSRLLG